MDFYRIWSLFKANCYHTKLWFDEHPALILIGAMIFLCLSVFNMDTQKTSAGQWFIIVVCVFLVLYAFGQMTGLGFGMSF